MNTEYAYVVYYKQRHRDTDDEVVIDKVFLDRDKADAYVNEANESEKYFRGLDKLHFSHYSIELIRCRDNKCHRI